MRNTSKLLLHGLAAAALISAALPASALTVFTLNVPTGLTYGTVSLTGGSDQVTVDVVLAPGYNFVDTGAHRAFGFNLAGSVITSSNVSILTPTSGGSYSFLTNFTQAGFGAFGYSFECAGQAGRSAYGCQGGNNLNSPNDEFKFIVSRSGITESSFISNADGYYFTADVYGPSPVGGSSLTFAVGSNVAVAPIPEPETYALMLAGLGFVGFMSRRRKTV